MYGRFFRLYMYTALAPLPLAAFAGESTQSVGISFLKSYVGVCLEGAVIVLACVIYSAFVSTLTVTSGEATTIVWSYLAETVFNMLVLVCTSLVNGNAMVVATSGGGKSMFVKLEILMLYLRFTKARFYVVDPENEYAPLVQELGGEVVNISVDSATHFNPLDFKYDKARPPHGCTLTKSICCCAIL